MDEKSIILVGPGVVGLTLCWYLREKGYAIPLVMGRASQGKEQVIKHLGDVQYTHDWGTGFPGARIILVAVPDWEIRNVCSRLESLDLDNTYVFHASGSVSYTVLDSLRGKGAHVGSIHPLQSFVCVETAVNRLPGAHYAVEGTGKALTMAKKLVQDLDGVPINIDPKMKALYHAGACISANYMVSMLRLAEMFFQASGIEEEKIVPAITHLVKSVIQNVETGGILDSMTGPVVRGDRKTLESQLDIIGKHCPRHLPLFRVFSLHCANIASQKPNVDQGQLSEIIRVLEKNLLMTQE